MPTFESCDGLFVWLGFFPLGTKGHKNSRADYFRVHDGLFIFIAAGNIGKHSLIYHRISALTESTEKKKKGIKLFYLQLTTKVSASYDSCGINYKIYDAFNEAILEFFIQL